MGVTRWWLPQRAGSPSLNGGGAAAAVPRWGGSDNDETIDYCDAVVCCCNEDVDDRLLLLLSSETAVRFSVALWRIVANFIDHRVGDVIDDVIVGRSKFAVSVVRSSAVVHLYIVTFICYRTRAPAVANELCVRRLSRDLIGKVIRDSML